MTTKEEAQKALDAYYVQNKHAGFLGNAPTWWAKGGSGYTAYVLGAERFTREAAESLVKESPDKFAMYKCADVDARLHLVFDSQDFKRLGTDEPCGWKSGYAALQSHIDAQADDAALKSACGSFFDSWHMGIPPETEDRKEFSALLFRFVKLWQTPTSPKHPDIAEKLAGWQPIETAPSDGTHIQVWWPTEYHAPITAHFSEDDYWKFSGQGRFMHTEPTHWMPLPIPPADYEMGGK